MATIERLDRVDMATADLGDATAVYQRNFGLKLRRAPGEDTAVLAIGDAEIHLLSGPSAASTIAATGEGMAALWLEADDVESVAKALENAGFRTAPIRKESGRRILPVDPQGSSQVALFIFDRRG